jgi:hypothetical protein
MKPSRAIDILAPLCIALHAGYAAAPFLADGLPILFDGHAHLSRTFFVARTLGEGAFPGFVMDWYGGYRALEFYSPGYFALSGAIAHGTSDVVATTKWILFGGQVAAVLALYAFVRRCFGDPLVAAFAALLFASCAEMRMALGVVCNFPSVGLYVGGPLLLWHVVAGVPEPGPNVGMGSGRSWARFAAGQALLIAGMGFFHLSNTLAILPGILAFELVWLGRALVDSRSRKMATLAFISSGVGALILLAPLWAPFLSGMNLVSLSIDRGGRSGGLNVEMVLRILSLREYTIDYLFVRAHSRAWLILAVGAGFVSLIPIARSWGHWRRPTRALVAGLVGSLFAVLVIDVRAVIATAFFVFPLCAAGLDRLAWLAAERAGSPGRLAVIALGFVAALVWPENRDTPLPRYAPADALEIYARLPDAPGHGRTFDVSESPMSLDAFYGESSFSPYFSGRAIPFGGYPQASPLALNVTMALAGKLVGDLRLRPTPWLSRDALDLLHLLHVEFVVDRRPEPILPRVNFAGPGAVLVDPRIVQLSNASPILACRRQTLVPETFPAAPRDEPRLMGLVRERWREEPLGEHRFPSLDSIYRTGHRRDWPRLVVLMRSMKIDRARGRCEVIHVERLLDSANSENPEISQVDLVSHREGSQGAELEVDAQGPSLLRLSYSIDPRLRVTIDGVEVERTADALTGAVVVHVPAGRHRILLQR